jgi:hypothetical protein
MMADWRRQFENLNLPFLDGGELSGFEFCGATQASCRWAETRVHGSSVALVVR